MSNDNEPITDSPDDPYIKRAIDEAVEIWLEAIFPERVAAEKRLAEFANDTVRVLAIELNEALDEERIADNDYYTAVALALLRLVGIDENTITRPTIS